MSESRQGGQRGQGQMIYTTQMGERFDLEKDFSPPERHVPAEEGGGLAEGLGGFGSRDGKPEPANPDPGF
jgi:hypothetical protein